MKPTFVKISPMATACAVGSPAAARAAAQEAFAAANAAWAAKDFAAVRMECSKVLAAEDLPPPYKSYAHLRLAQSYQAEKNARDAAVEYRRITVTADYPEVHRGEAEECLKEIDRMAKGLSARDVAASRTKIAPVNPGAEFFVAPDGRDSNPGTAARPFATLAKARDAVRALKAKGLPAGGVAVTLKSGAYPIAETLALAAEDSGTPEAPIVYRAERTGAAVLYGGARLTGFERVHEAAVLERLTAEARGKVQQCDLKALGITHYGELAVRGYNQLHPPPTLELYCDGRPQTLARWPNQGFVAAKELVAPGDPAKGEPSVIRYDGDRPARWTRAEEPWLFGYFKYLWADATARIAAIDPGKRTLTTARAYQYGSVPGMDATQGIVYYAFNLLEEIDEPGEWFLDRAKGMLYWWPPSDPATAVVEIGRLEVPMLVMEGAAHVRLEGLDFDLSRGDCMTLKDCEQCLVAACTVRRFAGNGVTIDGGQGNGIYGCDIHTIGRRATEVTGGDRQTLTPARHFVENCRIHAFGRIDRTYTPAVHLEGVGNRVAHNLMYACPSSVMRIEGNDHLIEYNDVHSAVQESDDQGAMELYLNPTYRGVVFRYNRFCHNGRPDEVDNFAGRAGIRFDDAISGMLVYGNIFYRTANGTMGGININGGRDNIIDNNIFADCRRGVSGGWDANSVAWKWIREGKAPADFYTDASYLARYPAIAGMEQGSGINHLWRNVFYNCGREFPAKRSGLDLLANGVFRNADPGFVDAGHGDFDLTPDAALFATVGFKPIPVAEIGLYDDPYRATWPVSTTPIALPDWRDGGSPPVCHGQVQLAAVWHVVAPLSRAHPPPAGAQLLAVPAQVEAEGRTLVPVTVAAKDGQVDLAGALGGTAADKTAWIYIPFQIPAGGLTTLGFGADWWLQAWVDGKLVCDTLATGNGPHPPSPADHMVTLDLAPGPHLAVVRFISGRGFVPVRHRWPDGDWPSLAGGALVGDGWFRRSAIRDNFHPVTKITTNRERLGQAGITQGG